MRTTTDLALNHGTYCSARCAEVLDRYRSRTALRTYPAADNGDLRRALAEEANVSPASILVANGSGPLLKTVIPHIIGSEIKSSATRSLRYLLRRTAYPLVTPRLTYSKVPAAAVRVGLRCELLPLAPENGFALDIDDLHGRLERHPGLVYLCNPNNPTGNLLLDRATLVELLRRHPDAWFVIDEAYAHYAEGACEQRLPELTRDHPNLVIIRSFSFAYGLGAVRVGYAVAPPTLVEDIEATQTPYGVGQLAAELAMASLGDRSHLEFVRAETARERARITAAIAGIAELTAYPSQANFILCRVDAPLTAAAIHDALLQRGLSVKVFEPFAEERYDAYFRITVGLPAENDALIEALADAIGGASRGRAA